MANNHKQFHALTKIIGANKEDKDILVYEYSGETTTSLRELKEKHPHRYDAMISDIEEKIKALPANYDPEADRWRKRCIAAISAWLDIAKIETKTNRLDYIKSIACRIDGKQICEFNQLTIPQLRTVYNSFLRQKKTLESANGFTALLVPGKN